MSPGARSGSFLSRMRHGVTQEKNETKGRKREDGTHAWHLICFLGCCAMQPLSENGQRRFMRAEIIRRITGSGQITDGISVAPLPYMEDRSNLSPSTYLTTIALSESGSIGRPSKRNFCNCSIESPARSLPPLCRPLTIIEYIVSTWERAAGRN